MSDKQLLEMVKDLMASTRDMQRIRSAIDMWSRRAEAIERDLAAAIEQIENRSAGDLT